MFKLHFPVFGIVVINVNRLVFWDVLCQCSWCWMSVGQLVFLMWCNLIDMWAGLIVFKGFSHKCLYNIGLSLTPVEENQEVELYTDPVIRAR